MSGGQDEASEYIKTGGVNVFKKTERTRCGNCVYFDNGKCVRMPMTWTKLPEDYCGEFVDREPEAKPAEPQPAGELRDWWVFPSGCNEFPDMAYKSPAKGFVHVREVPSPERVREALDAFVKDFLVNPKADWESHKRDWPKTTASIYALLRSLGIDTEGL